MPYSHYHRIRKHTEQSKGVDDRKCVHKGSMVNLTQIKMALQQLTWNLTPTEYITEKGIPSPDIMSTIMDYNL